MQAHLSWQRSVDKVLDNHFIPKYSFYHLHRRFPLKNPSIILEIRMPKTPQRNGKNEPLHRPNLVLAIRAIFTEPSQNNQQEHDHDTSER